MSSGHPIRRLKAVAVVWWGLAALPLLVSVTVKWFSLAVVIAIAVRLALGVFAWKKAQSLREAPSARLGIARVIFLLAPLVLFAGGVYFERVEVRVREPSFCAPEWVLPWRGDMNGRPWFGDRDNPSMIMCAAMLVALGLGVAITAARREPEVVRPRR